MRAQQVPSAQENIACLVTFGTNGDHSSGDDDFSQTVFFSVPKTQTEPFYIRIFDPEVFGELDEERNGWNTRMQYSVYGGKDAYSNKDARSVIPTGNYRSGILMDSKTFGNEAVTENKWISMGPFNPQQGELVAEFDSYIFKVVIDGIKGDDGNGYKLFLSAKNSENIPVEGANAFTYEYSIRLQSSTNSVAHLYPFADNLVTGFRIKTFDFDHDGDIKLYSSVKNGHPIKASGNNEWSSCDQRILDEEKNKCLDLQIIKKGEDKGDMVLYITNEYDVPVPLFAVPVGGAPKYLYKIKLTKIAKDK